MDMVKPQIKISVRNIVEFLLRSGDIDSSGGYGDIQLLQQGTKFKAIGLYKKVPHPLLGQGAEMQYALDVKAIHVLSSGYLVQYTDHIF